MPYQLAMEMTHVAIPDPLMILFQRLAEGDGDALSALYDELAPKIFGLALWRMSSKDDADDIVQEVFVKLASKANQLGSIRRPLTYTLRIAHNECMDRLRQRKRQAQISEDVLLISDSSRYADYAVRLSSFIAELPPDQREAIYLRHFLGLSLREIASSTGVTLFTAASRCRLGIQKLKARMGDKK